MNKTFKYIVLLALACFVGKANAQELKTEVSRSSTWIIPDWRK